MTKPLFFTIMLFASSSVLGQMPNTISKADKVYGLSRFWSEVNYNFIYLDQVDRKAWDSSYRSLISEVQETSNDYDYYRLLQRFCAQLKDGHTKVHVPDTIWDNLLNEDFGDYWILVSNVDGRAVVTHINADKKKEIPIGSVVTMVNGLETKEYLEKEVIPYISSSTDYILEDQAIRTMFRAPTGTRFEVEFTLPNGKKKIITLVHSRSNKPDVFPRFKQRNLLDFEWMGNGIAYVSLNSFGDNAIVDSFEQILPELFNAKGLILDLRYNDGGSTLVGLDILKHLTMDTLLYGARSRSRLHVAVYKAWGNWVTEKDTAGDDWATRSYIAGRDLEYYDFPYTPDTVKDVKGRFVAPTIILTGHSTASAAEDFLIYTDNQKHMTTLGEPTYGSTGQPALIDMPGGGYTVICTKEDTYPDGRKFVGIGVQPDVFVSRSLEDYINNTDPALERALELLER